MDKYKVTVIGDGEYDVEADDIAYQNDCIMMYKIGKLEGIFPKRKTSIIRLDDEQDDPHTKYKNV